MDEETGLEKLKELAQLTTANQGLSWMQNRPDLGLISASTTYQQGDSGDITKIEIIAFPSKIYCKDLILYQVHGVVFDTLQVLQRFFFSCDRICLAGMH